MRSPRHHYHYIQNQTHGYTGLTTYLALFIIFGTALLLLFLIHSTNKGIIVHLPPKNYGCGKIKDRNIFQIVINSNEDILVQGQKTDLKKLKNAAKAFINSCGKHPNGCESSVKAILLFQPARTSNYDLYLAARNQLKLAYAELRAEYLEMTLEEYYELPKNTERYYQAKNEYPEIIMEDNWF